MTNILYLLHMSLTNGGVVIYVHHIVTMCRAELQPNAAQNCNEFLGGVWRIDPCGGHLDVTSSSSL